MLKKFFFSVLFFIAFKPAIPQIIIHLDTLTHLEDGEVSIEILSEGPKEDIIPPSFNESEANIPPKYLTLFYSWDAETDENISIIVRRFENEELLYIDKNNDNNLSNDGPPVLFPLSQNSVSFYIVSPKDPEQKLKLALLRKPDMPDSLAGRFVDGAGNLNPKFLSFVKPLKGDFDFEGKKGTFFFDYRISLRKGQININGKTYLVGLFDWSNNGAFNDPDDQLLIDHNNTGRLNMNDPADVYTLKDVINIGGSGCRIKEADKYGKYVVLEETNDESTNLFATRLRRDALNYEKKDSLRGAFWENKFASLEGDSLHLSDYKGKLLFINVWGEWCKPCMEEIDDLAYAYNMYKDSIVFLSVLTPANLDKAKEIIKNKKMLWKHVLINKELKEVIKITGVPLNLLIYPDGITCIRKNILDRTSFEKLINEYRTGK